jgi:hypothetical protein
VIAPVLLTVLIKELADGDDGAAINCTLTLVQRIFAAVDGGDVKAPVDDDDEKMTFQYLFNDQVWCTTR